MPNTIALPPNGDETRMAKDDYSINPEHREAGWYRDPLPEFDGQRWWDGNEWTTHARPRPSGMTALGTGIAGRPAKQKNSRLRWVALAGAVVVAGVIATSFDWGSSPVNPTDNQFEQAEKLCIKGVKNQLRDPGSAQFQGVNTVFAGAKKAQAWEVTGQVNAANGFGGMAGFADFSCDVTPKGDGMTATVWVDGN